MKAPLASASAVSADGGLGDVDLARVLGVGGGGEDVVDGVDLVGLGADVDLGRVADGGAAVEDACVVEVGLGGGEADQDGVVDLGGEHGRVEDAGDVEPHAADPDPLAGEDAVDAEALGGGGAEHADRLGRGRGVEERGPGRPSCRPRRAG